MGQVKICINGQHIWDQHQILNCFSIKYVQIEKKGGGVSLEIDDADDRRMRATRALMDKGAQGQLGKERKAWEEGKSKKCINR